MCATKLKFCGRQGRIPLYTFSPSLSLSSTTETGFSRSSYNEKFFALKRKNENKQTERERRKKVYTFSPSLSLSPTTKTDFRALFYNENGTCVRRPKFEQNKSKKKKNIFLQILEFFFFFFFFFSHVGTYAKFIYNFVSKDGTGGSYFNLTLSYSNRAQRGETSLRYSLISSPPHTFLYSTLQWPARTKLGIKSGVRNNILS